MGFSLNASVRTLVMVVRKTIHTVKNMESRHSSSIRHGKGNVVAGDQHCTNLMMMKRLRVSVVVLGLW